MYTLPVETVLQLKKLLPHEERRVDCLLDVYPLKTLGSIQLLAIAQIAGYWSHEVWEGVICSEVSVTDRSFTSRTLKFTLLTLFQHDTCGLQRIGLTRPFCLAGTARSDFHTRLRLSGVEI